MARGIVFDMDGTLINSEGLHIKSWMHMCLRYEIPFNKTLVERFIGLADSRISEIVVEEFGLDVSALHFVEEKREVYATLSGIELNVMPGVKEGLEKLKHLPLAVATMSNRKDAETSLASTELRGYFNAVVSADDVKRHKPDPECYTQACQILGINPKESYAVEDSAPGVKAAKRAGLFTLAVATTIAPDHLFEADLIFEDTSGAMLFLAKIFGEEAKPFI